MPTFTQFYLINKTANVMNYDFSLQAPYGRAKKLMVGLVSNIQAGAGEIGIMTCSLKIGGLSLPVYGGNIDGSASGRPLAVFEFDNPPTLSPMATFSFDSIYLDDGSSGNALTGYVCLSIIYEI